jgi:type I restriction enzyme S subunit
MLSGHRRAPLSELCSFLNGNGFRPTDWKPSGLPIIRIQNLNGSEIFNYFDGEVRDEWIVEPGDLLFAWAGVKGVSFGPTIWPGPKGVLNQHIYRVVPNKGVDRYWLYAALRLVTSRIEAQAHGFKSSLVHVHKEDITGQMVELPPLMEQRKIAEILRAWDEAIEKTEALLRAAQDHHDAYSRSFFKPCHPSPGGCGSNWSDFSMGELFRERDEPGAESDVLLSITMSGGVIDRDGVGRKDSSSEDKTKYKLVLPGDIGYNTMRMWQGVSGLSSLRGIVSPAYTVLIPKQDKIFPRYAAHLFKSRRMIHDFERYSQGLTSDTWNLKYPVFAEIKVSLPSIVLQEQQANFLDAMNEEISVITRQRDALAVQKRGLMQKLLTGEWRVKC